MAKKEIPTLKEFSDYCKTVSIYHHSMDFQIEAKYETWVDNGWKDGYNKPIKNWKLKIKNTMVYFKVNFNQAPKFEKIKPCTKIESAAKIVANAFTEKPKEKWDRKKQALQEFLDNQDSFTSEQKLKVKELIDTADTAILEKYIYNILT